MKLNTTIRIGDREALYCIRRWCMFDMSYTDEDERECPGCTDPPHIARRRRTYVCQAPECEQGHFTREAFERHECGSAY